MPKNTRRIKTKSPIMVASSTPRSREAAKKRNCEAVGGKWNPETKKCVGGVL